MRLDDEWHDLPNPVSPSQLDFSQRPKVKTNKKWSNKTYARLVILCLATPVVIGFFIILASIKSKERISEGDLNLQFKNASKMLVSKMPHDVHCYSQGLFFLNSTHLFESCGGYPDNMGPSYYQVMEYNSKKKTLNRTYQSELFFEQVFLEGSTLFPKNKMIYLLTWKQSKAYRLNPTTFQIIDTLPWKAQGWGITHNNTHLIISTGSSFLYITDEQLNVLERIRVTQGGRRVEYLNELQWVSQKQGDYVYANVYGSKLVYKVSMQDSDEHKRGEVVEGLDCQSFVQEQEDYKIKQVLNGIAYHEPSDKMLLTGKMWKHFYLISDY